MITNNSLYGQYAGFVTRAVAMVIDLIIIAAISAVLVVIVRLILDMFSLREPTIEIGALLLAIFQLVFGVLYFTLFWVLVGQTPGKMLMGVRVVRTNGEPVTFGVALRRWIGYYISAILFLGFFWVLLDARRQGWHDKIGNTYVIYAWKATLPPRLVALRERLRSKQLASENQK
jgi:uncharacterized RDD family membrane protein YckC